MYQLFNVKSGSDLFNLLILNNESRRSGPPAYYDKLAITCTTRPSRPVGPKNIASAS